MAIEDPLQYKDVQFLRAEVDFSGSEKMEKARRVYLVFLTVLLFIEFAGVEIQSATLAVVTAKLHRPSVVTMGFWALFLYTFTVYFLSAQKELALFSLKNAGAGSFFSQLNRRDLERRLNEASGGRAYLKPGSGLVKHHDESFTRI